MKWYDDATKGFGFVAADRGRTDIYVHASMLDLVGGNGPLRGLAPLAVDVAQGQEGLEAVSQRPI